MKIIFFDDAHTFGGAQVAAISMAKFMQENFGFEVAFFCSKKNTRLIERLSKLQGVEIRHDGYEVLPFPIISHLVLLWKLPSLVHNLRKTRPDLCIINMSGIEFGWLYIYAAKILKLKRLLWLHNTFTYSNLLQRRGVRGMLDKFRDVLGDFAARRVWRDLVTVSHSARADLLNRIRRKSGIQVMGNSVSAPESTVDVPADLLIRTIGDYEAKKIVVIPGRISFGDKGQDQVVACMAEMDRQAMAVVFIGDGEDLVALRELCIPYKNAFFVGWQESVGPYLARADVVLLPSRFETQGLIAMESMFSGAPVLTSAIPAFSELMGPTFVVDFADGAEVCRKINWITSLDKTELQAAYAERLQVCSGAVYMSSVKKILADAKC